MASRRSRSAAHPSGARAAPRRSAGRLAALAACAVLAGCSVGADDRVVVESESTHWPWETAPPTGTPAPLAPGAEATAVATVSRGPTGTPTETPTATPTESAEPSPEGSESTPSATNTEPSGGSGTSEGPTARMATEVVTLTNAERQKAGCPPLANNRTLRQVATAHSEDMAERDFFSHTTPDGEDPSDRAAAAGYAGYSGENIAMGYRSAEAVVDAWMDSSGHRANILNCSSTEIGVGVADSPRGLYWTQMFGRR